MLPVSAMHHLSVSSSCAMLVIILGHLTGVQGIFMKDPYQLSSASIPAAYVQILLEIMQEKGFAADLILHKSRIGSHIFSQPDGRISARQWSRLVLVCLSLAGDSGLGYANGMRLRPTSHGALGFALLSSASIGQALQLASVFFGMRLPHYRIEIKQQDGLALVTLSEVHPVIDANAEQTELLRRFFHETLLIGMVLGWKSMTTQPVEQLEIWVDWPEPAYHPQFAAQLPTIRFNQTVNQIRMPTSYLDISLPLADPMAFQQALAQCEMERVRFSRNISDTLQRVKTELVLQPYQGYLTLEQVAEKMDMSSRTLKRRLQELGSSFLQLLDQVKQQDAERLLHQGDMDIQQIANTLGYENPTNFSRAFKKWTGKTPREYKAERLI